MTPENNALRLFISGYNCAEAVLLATSQDLLLDRVETIIPRVATGFGGGLSRNGDVCGALTGGIMRIGLAAGRNSAEESRDRCYEAVDRFYSAFVKEFGNANVVSLQDWISRRRKEEQHTRLGFTPNAAQNRVLGSSSRLPNS